MVAGGLSWRVWVTPVWCSIRVSCRGVKFDGTRNTDSSTALYFVDEIEHFPDILIGFTPLANNQPHHGKPIVLVAHAQPFKNDAGPVVNRKWNALAGRDLPRAIRTGPVSSKTNGTSGFFCGWGTPTPK